MPELSYDRKRWQTFADLSFDDFVKAGAPVQHLAFQYLANQLLALTEPTMLEAVWKSGAAKLNPPGGTSVIDWKQFAEELARRIE